jgi:hypothetical protein
VQILKIDKRGIAMAISKKVLFYSIEQIENYREKIVNTTNNHINELLFSSKGIDFLRKVKFEQCGYDPLFEHETNFIEQTNQTFTYLVCLDATELLLKKYPTKRFHVNFGTESGYDVESEDVSIICECFAATTPDSNKKLELDVKKVFKNTNAIDRYVIFYAEHPKVKHVENIREKYKGIDIIVLDSVGGIQK